MLMQRARVSASLRADAITLAPQKKVFNVSSQFVHMPSKRHGLLQGAQRSKTMELHRATYRF